MADNDWLNTNKTWQKWKGLGEGGELKYGAGTWVKPKDEDRLIRSLMNREKIMIKDWRIKE
jgi:hypothetical protein